MKHNGKICIFFSQAKLKYKKEIYKLLPRKLFFFLFILKGFHTNLHQTLSWVLDDLRSHFYLCFSESMILWSLIVVIFQPFFQNKFQEPASCLACGFEGCLALRCKIWFLRHHTDPQSHYFCQIFINFTKKASLRLSYVLKTTFKNPDLATHHISHSFLARIIAVLSLLWITFKCLWHWHRSASNIPQPNGPLANLLWLTQTILSSHRSLPPPPEWARNHNKKPVPFAAVLTPWQAYRDDYCQSLAGRPSDSPSCGSLCEVHSAAQGTNG